MAVAIMALLPGILSGRVLSPFRIVGSRAGRHPQRRKGRFPRAGPDRKKIFSSS